MNDRIDCLCKKLEPIIRELSSDETFLKFYFELNDLFGLLTIWFALGDFKRGKVSVSDENMTKCERLADWLIELYANSK